MTKQKTKKQSKADERFIPADAQDDQGNFKAFAEVPPRTLFWFKKTVKMGDDEASLELAKRGHAQGDPLAETICHSNRVTADSRGSGQVAQVIQEKIEAIRSRVERNQKCPTTS